MTGGPISDRRLVRCENDIITFMARNKDKGSPLRQVPEKLSGVEFTRRWSLHILPRGFTKTRYYGGYSGRHRSGFIALCQQLCPQSRQIESQPTAPVSEPEAEDRVPRCPRCEQPMQLSSDTRRPRWRDLFYGPDHHPWFAT